ncbi:MAG: SHOCT domain-containing protein [Leptolyngbyaceae cyanobacterium bins.302]|nr:SHOCT domain-containing protein [Leptolyngbyaceae cyanobacterium bins.302]
MQRWNELLSKPKDRKIASLLALAGTVSPVAGFHKFYLRQPVWGVLYVLLSWTPIPRVASGIEAVWYLFQDGHEFDRRFNAELPLGSVASAPASTVSPEDVGAIAEALRKLDQLRADGLISEYEFEQKRRQLLDRIA